MLFLLVGHSDVAAKVEKRNLFTAGIAFIQSYCQVQQKSIICKALFL